MPFTGKRFFALTTNSCVLATVGGLTIDGNCQVLDTDDKVIGGLYAVGNARAISLRATTRAIFRERPSAAPSPSVRGRRARGEGGVIS